KRVNYTIMEQVKWFDRKFDFTTTGNIFPMILGRLRAAPARYEEKFGVLPPYLLTTRVDNTWSIKENLGHLSDLEPLWQKRLDDIVTGEPELSPTDLLNKKTDLANHNDATTEDLLQRFRQLRTKTIILLEQIDEPTIFKSSLHPRLKTPMRTMDLFLFVAEHDDHHLARITELAKLLAH
ncbi:MAG TPA: DinB family protein, partial [Puia sp.]|nr:DinB family protein [Puia sp.]